MTEPEIESAIRDRTLCGRCKASCLMVWQPPADAAVRLSADDLPHGATRDRELNCWYLIRCTFFRITVASPTALTHCSNFEPLATPDE